LWLFIKEIQNKSNELRWCENNFSWKVPVWIEVFYFIFHIHTEVHSITDDQIILLHWHYRNLINNGQFNYMVILCIRIQRKKIIIIFWVFESQRFSWPKYLKFRPVIWIIRTVLEKEHFHRLVHYLWNIFWNS